MILLNQARYDESIAENERALALNPANVDAYAGLGWDYLYLGQFEKSLEYFDKAIRLSPHDPAIGVWFDSKSGGLFRAEAVRSGDRMGPPGDRDRSEFQFRPHRAVGFDRS